MTCYSQADKLLILGQAGTTALMIAIEHGHEDAIDFLLVEAKADVNRVSQVRPLLRQTINKLMITYYTGRKYRFTHCVQKKAHICGRETRFPWR
jgi:ankyrin repeat protein